MNALFFAASGDSLSPWNAPVQSSVVRNLRPHIDASISSMHGSGYGVDSMFLNSPTFFIITPEVCR